MGMKNRFQEAIQNVQRQRHLARRSVAMVLGAGDADRHERQLAAASGWHRACRR